MIEFDIEHNNVWNETWETKTCNLQENLELFRKSFVNAPKLIPIYSHRYLISGSNSSIVISIHQTDMIVYGENLAIYLQYEFLRDDLDIQYDEVIGDYYLTKIPHIPFYSNYIN